MSPLRACRAVNRHHRHAHRRGGGRIAILPDDILERFDRESPEMGKQVRNNLVRLFGSD